jgi:hypothetical protein
MVRFVACFDQRLLISYSRLHWQTYQLLQRKNADAAFRQAQVSVGCAVVFIRFGLFSCPVLALNVVLLSPGSGYGSQSLLLA